MRGGRRGRRGGGEGREERERGGRGMYKHLVLNKDCDITCKETRQSKQLRLKTTPFFSREK